MHSSVSARRCVGSARLPLLLLLGCGADPVSHADTITDWDAKATAEVVTAPVALGERECAIVNLAMFDAVNSLARKYPAYLVREDGFEGASADAAAASAAANALARLYPQRAAEFKNSLDEYLKGLSGTEATLGSGVQLGKRVAERLVAARADDGANAPDAYRPKTQPGVYVPTAPTIGSTWPTLRPFVLERPDQFRPGPPVSLTSSEWAADYNEIKVYGARNSPQRTPEQTETARFWLMVGPNAYHPIARQIVAARHLTLVDSARFMALYSVTLADGLIAALDAKYHYEFWRPITAIRNGDMDGNPDTEVDPTWQPVDATPMHPEYPCAHCVLSGAAIAMIEANGGLGGLRELRLTSSTAPGVTHRWSSLDSLAAEVANARIWAGFHYRSSTKGGTALGREVGRYVAAHFGQPGTQQHAQR
jgi:PAP2 superfamily